MVGGQALRPDTTRGHGGRTDTQARLQLFALAYNLANFLRRLAVPTRDSKRLAIAPPSVAGAHAQVQRGQKDWRLGKAALAKRRKLLFFPRQRCGVQSEGGQKWLADLEDPRGRWTGGVP